MALFKRKKDAEEADAMVAAIPAGDIDAEEVMRKYDKESNTRIWEGIPKIVVTAVMVLFSVYCLAMTLLSTEQAEARLARFLAFVIVIGYMMYPARKTNHKVNHIPWYDIVLMAAGFGAFMYYAVNCTEILLMGARIEPLHVALGIVGILVLVELCRRCVGLPIIIVVGCLVIYAFYWQFSSSSSADLYASVRKIVQKLFYTTSGVIGTPINVCYTYIVLFVIFGAFLERTGISNFFISLANRIAGWSSGGAAKVAVIASALCGMVSGSSVGNTVTTGSVTIPMMKKVGYKPEFAGAVEAASSSGGQIMPPIMGAAAFLMAEYMGIPYLEVATKAIIPALLYFAGIFIAVHLEAKKLGLKGVPKSELPTFGYLAKNCYLVLPLVLLVWLVASGTRTMAASAAISILGAFLVGFVNFLLTNWREREEGATFGAVLAETVKIALFTCADAFAAGAKNTIAVAVACAMAGMIAGCITVTGLASTIINVIVLMAGDFIIIGLVFTMVCCLILGMGVPTTANYCIMASTCAPILMQLGIDPVCAHFFVFYFGIAADITPPVALAAYAASAIAKSRPMATAVNATKLGIAKFVVPYIFAFSPVLLLVGDNVTPVTVVLNTTTALVGVFGLQCALTNTLFHRHLNPLFRLVLAVGGLCMMIPGTFTDVVGLAVIVGMCLVQWMLARRDRANDVEVSADDEPTEAAA
ncbi:MULTISPECIES: TRAP transporter fused permease subunit [unclassified Adlercreutzia]|uniref:TRAP transporter permease n=1 Tax=unclassified Adlercreutzia TaxID=2636013 RepID=UPI0019818B84|nr:MULTISPECIES: TRAP transporter fused permease subunit [unclassified Adlercreutzia]